MTIKINVGVNKKIGLPDYGSAGSHCNIEIEADNSILDNAEHFLQRVKDAYEVARQSVESELAHHRTHQSSQSPTETAPKQEYRNDHSYSNSRSQAGNSIASPKQQQFIASLLKGIKGLSWQTLDKYCTSKFGSNTSQLTPKQASELIDDLKAAKDGRKEIAA
jgi:phosphoribosyl 1,2-cyclic phosphodiesterase